MTATEAKDLIAGLPGEELIAPGITDATEGRWTPEALLLFIAQGRLVRAGFSFLDTIDSPDGEIEPLLYAALGRRDPESAYGFYNSWKRRLDSFIRGLEQRVSAPEA